MKFLRVFLQNDSGLLRGCHKEDNKIIKVEQSSVAKSRVNELIYFSPESKIIIRVFLENKDLKKELYDITTIPGDNFHVNFFEGKQSLVSLSDILESNSVDEIIKSENKDNDNEN